ncbi:unnamed protein product [Phytomonas sp. EM1]|nr:unnamed protein product [Phytomonas sp. EM1]|eukprot:CCW60324.1 unnamed protein product [Phytomonas sp. isolate EM1]
MSALLTQLQNILQSWDDIQPLLNEHSKTEDPSVATTAAINNSVILEDNPLHRGENAGDSIIDEGHTQLSSVSFPTITKVSELVKDNGSFSLYHNSRQVLSRLELARAALALFASNAGAYRPILTNLLRYVFECIDFLIDNQAPPTHASPTDDTSAAATGNVSTSCGLGLEISKAEDVVASAHQKVLLVESRMSALVEESTAQRDRFKAQLLVQQQTQTKLEHLLEKQVELNHMLTSYPVSQHDGEGPVLDFSRTMNMTSRRRAAYAQQLIARAEKESTIMELDARVEELTLERDNLQEKLVSLKKLNTKYARQAIELSARLNILRNHNIALASDAVLYQHDAIREKQKSQKIERDLMVTRNIILVLLEVRRHEMLFRFNNPIASTNAAKTEKNVETMGTKGSMEDPLQSSKNDILDACSHLFASSESPGNESRCRKDDLGLASNPVSLNRTVHVNSDALACTTEDFLASVQDNILRKQLQDIMHIKDASNGGAAKSALLKLLNLQWGGFTGNNKLQTGKQLPMLKDVRSHPWVRPYGRNCNVPLHLRSRDCVMLIPFHPLVAECFVHELLSQRLEFFEFYGRAARSLDSVAKGNHFNATDVVAQRKDLEKCSSFAKASEGRNFCFCTTKTMSVPLDEFIVLFINMVWLNKNAIVVPEATPPQDRTEKDTPSTPIQNQRLGQSLTNDPTANTLEFFHQYSSFHGLEATSERTIPEQQSQLTMEGLKLAYGLDVASRRQDCSFLTYAYGLASRGELSEVIFTVVRQERDVFLALCEAVEKEHISRKGSRYPVMESSVVERYHSPRSQNHPPVKSNMMPLQGTSTSDSESTIKKTHHPLGCIPTPQLARILICMFPSYPISRIEQMVMAAIEDGADTIQAPHMLHYTVLLPERLLPGSVASGTAVELSAFWSEGRFATLFYKSICDDALESMQLLEDTLQGFGDSLAMQKRHVGLMETFRNSTNFDSMDLLVSAEQLTTFGLKVLPVAEGRRWGPALTSVLTRCPLFRPASLALRAGSIRENETQNSEGEVAVSPTSQPTNSGQEIDRMTSASPTRKSITGVSAFTSGVGYVKLAEVMLYLRCHVILRRGLYSNYVEAAQPAQDMLGALSQEEAFQSVWTEAHLEYVKTLQDTWEHYALEGESVLVADAEFFWMLLFEADPHRSRIWATAAASHGSPLLRH